MITGERVPRELGTSHLVCVRLETRASLRCYGGRAARPYYSCTRAPSCILSVAPEAELRSLHAVVSVARALHVAASTRCARLWMMEYGLYW